MLPPPPHPPEEGSEGARTLTEQQLRKVIQRKLVDYKPQGQAKGLRFSLKVDHILILKEAQDNRCAACNIERLWAYQPKDTQQFSVNRFDNAGHIHDNVGLTCLKCNRKRGAAALSAWDPHPREAECRAALQGVPSWQNHAVAHPASNTTRAHRAWSPSVRAGEPQKTTQGL